MNNKKTIRVIIYSYKGKMLKDVVRSAMSQSSGETILTFDIWDQYPLIRNEVFSNIENTNYNHIFWDHIHGPTKYIKASGLLSKEDYVLILSDNIILPSNWDTFLISLVEDKDTIVSGSGQLDIVQNNLFYLDKVVKTTNEITETKYINNDFIFTSNRIFQEIKYPSYLKYHGVDDHISFVAFCKGISIISCPSQYYNVLEKMPLESLYTPFSLDHNYNEVVSLIKNKSNNYVSLTNTKEAVEGLIKYKGIDLNNLFPLPFENNDVLYDPHNMSFDSINSRKFMTKVNYI